MSQVQTALNNYSNIVAELKEHEQANEGVFSKHKSIVMRMVDADNAVRDAAAEAGEGASNATHRVTVTPQTQKTFNEPAILALASKGVDITGIISEHTRPPRITIGEIH